ncbi:MAG TPA: hypothetical protein VF173_22205 [Thermoanaerobaculia bacterium]|nr:hypothetical protein [Thermoanaerobaculia bacterium]
MAAPPRVPRYELHIRPLFRLMDRDAMQWSFDPWSYEQVKGKARAILTRINLEPQNHGLMPPLAAGGPWPPEWVSLFRRWVEADCPRLQLGTGRYEAALADGTLTLTATGEFPAPGYRAWFDRQPSPPGGTRQYLFYFEPPDGAAPPALEPFKVRQEDPVSEPVSRVIVIDAQGAHEIPVRQEVPAL